MTSNSPLASSKDVAEHLGITENSLAKLRMDGTGPEFVRVGQRNIRYRWSAVEAWIDDQTHQSTDDYFVAQGAHA